MMTPQPSITHYRMTSKLGTSRLAEVRRAMDIKLGLDCAMKILRTSCVGRPVPGLGLLTVLIVAFA
ncbi:MAG: hypothetical protein LAP87_04775 [Acidobacteriia bacterium]|nr:hypothetical protein [Terriglobia bacterium]